MQTAEIFPHNQDIEKSILASCFLYPDSLTEFAGRISAEDFYTTRHQHIYRAILDQYQQGLAVELPVVADVLNRQGLLEKCGGGSYLSAICDEPPAIDCQAYGDSLKEYAARRRLIEVGNAVVKMGFRPDLPSHEAIDRAESMIKNIDSGLVHEAPASLRTLTVEAIERYESLYQSGGSLTGIPTNFASLNLMTCGLQKSDLIIVAARPSMGKTALALNFARFAANAGFPVGIFSLEMSKGQLFNRLMAAESDVNLLKFLDGSFGRNDWDRIVEASEVLSKLPIHIDDTDGLSHADLRRRARRLKNDHDVALLIIDYLQLMTGDQGYGRVEEVSSISRNLKGIAKELNVPVVVLSQLNRACEIREDKRPRLSDLRDSGAIEQDADLVLFIYRESRDGDTAEINVAKQRNGPTGTVKIGFVNRTAKFYDLETM